MHIALPVSSPPANENIMSSSKLIVAVSMLSVAATAHAGFLAILPESATVSLVFAGLAAIGLVVFRKRESPIEA